MPLRSRKPIVPWISGAVLAGGAVFSYPGRDYVLVGLMLFLPLLDRVWQVPAIPRSRSHYLAWAGLLISGIALLAWRPSEMPFTISTLLTATQTRHPQCVRFRRCVI